MNQFVGLSRRRRVEDKLTPRVADRNMFSSLIVPVSAGLHEPPPVPLGEQNDVRDRGSCWLHASVRRVWPDERVGVGDDESRSVISAKISVFQQICVAAFVIDVKKFVDHGD